MKNHTPNIVETVREPLLVPAMEDVTARLGAEEALVKAGALQNAILNSANFSSIATDASGVIQIFNVGAETVRPLIEQHRHELTVSLPLESIWMVADAARMEQVVGNLLTNAAKYTEGGGHICLALLPHIFDLFTQADRSLDRSQGGLGIGLALVQRLTELHGGKVDAFSIMGEGSEFVVRLPVLSNSVPGASGMPEPDSTLVSRISQLAPPLKVLVVDDNVDTVLGFSILLNAAGHDVRTAHDGLSAVEAAIDYCPDVVLLDIGLPGLNGYEVAKRIRQHPDLRHAVLIALTGYGQNADRQTSQQAGFNHHLVKPARIEELRRILANVQGGLQGRINN